MLASLGLFSLLKLLLIKASQARDRLSVSIPTIIHLPPSPFSPRYHQPQTPPSKPTTMVSSTRITHGQTFDRNERKKQNRQRIDQFETESESLRKAAFLPTSSSAHGGTTVNVIVTTTTKSEEERSLNVYRPASAMPTIAGQGVTEPHDTSSPTETILQTRSLSIPEKAYDSSQDEPPSVLTTNRTNLHRARASRTEAKNDLSIRIGTILSSGTKSGVPRAQPPHRVPSGDRTPQKEPKKAHTDPASDEPQTLRPSELTYWYG